MDIRLSRVDNRLSTLGFLVLQKVASQRVAFYFFLNEILISNGLYVCILDRVIKKHFFQINFIHISSCSLDDRDSKSERIFSVCTLEDKLFKF